MWVHVAGVEVSDCEPADGCDVWLSGPAAWWAPGLVAVRVFSRSPIGLHQVFTSTLDRLGLAAAGLCRIQIRGVPADGYRVELSAPGGALAGDGRADCRAWRSASVLAPSTSGELVGDEMHIEPLVAPGLSGAMLWDSLANSGQGGWRRARASTLGGVVVSPSLVNGYAHHVLAVGVVAAPLSAVAMRATGPTPIVVPQGTVPAVFFGGAGVSVGTGFPVYPGSGLVLSPADLATIYVVASAAGSSVRWLAPN